MRDTKSVHDVVKLINIFYFPIALVIAFGLPATYFLEDYWGGKEEVSAWAEVQSATVNRAIESNPDIWPFQMRQLLDLIKNNAPDDDDETTHSILDARYSVLVKVPPKAIPSPAVVEDVPLYLHNTIIGYYRSNVR